MSHFGAHPGLHPDNAVFEPLDHLPFAHLDQEALPILGRVHDHFAGRFFLGNELHDHCVILLGGFHDTNLLPCIR